MVERFVSAEASAAVSLTATRRRDGAANAARHLRDEINRYR
jgi:hypothetical protein